MVRQVRAIASLFIIFVPFTFLNLGLERALGNGRLSSVISRAATPVQSEKPDIHTCSFQQSGADWKGTCTPSFIHNPVITITPAKEITTGAWRKGIEPTSVWAGKMTYDDGPDPIEIETYSNGQGVMRTTSGWFPISNYDVSRTAARFDVDMAKEVPPSDLDHQIVERARAILSSDAVWNRADNRKCSPTDTKWSIYCAMEKATIEVTGGFHHRRPALELVRQIVDERTAGRDYHHRLMDYNNDRSTQLKDVQSLFADALARMSR
ncbi:MAG TPA: hypothetical protein VI756_13070 [Blastocatellia bacterium]